MPLFYFYVLLLKLIYNHAFIIIIIKFRTFSFKNKRPGNLDFNIDYTLTCSILLFDLYLLLIMNYRLL
jgi:hypothetical protein